MKVQTGSTINQRIQYIMDELDFNETKFSNKIGVSKTALTRVIKNESDPTYAMIRNITTVFPVSQEWLWLGEGRPWTEADILTWKAKVKGTETPHVPDSDMNNRLKILRIENDLSQTLFAVELGVTSDVIENIEANRNIPTIPMLRRLHEEFGINPMWVIYGDEPRYLESKEKKIKENE